MIINNKRFEKIIAFLRDAPDTTNMENALRKMREEEPNSEIKLAKDLKAYTEDNQRFESLNYLKDLAYETAKNSGFHQNNENIIIGNYLCNLHSEISELWEAWRKDSLHKPCDKAEKMKELTGIELTCAEEELADIFLRLADTSKALNIDLAKAVKIKNEYNRTRSHRHGGKLA